jgi:hypothetical protein
MKSKKYEIGQRLGPQNQFLILETIHKSKLNGSDKNYVVQCQICKEDPELYGSAIYSVNSEYLDPVKGKQPCGCSRSPKRTEQQWAVLLSRKAKEKNHTFSGFVGGKYVSQTTKLHLKCNDCNHEWLTCSAANYIRDRNCPKCADIRHSERRLKSNDHFISKFRNTGLFPDHQYKFEPTAKRSRLWNVYCSVCDESFTSDRSNLVAGKIPCDCGTGGGYDVSKRGYFYVLKVHLNGKVITKFGISNFPKRRLSMHRYNLKDNQILDHIVFTGNGSEILAFESELKRNLPIENQYIDGFRSECCSIVLYESIVKQATLRFEAVDNLVI